MWTFRRENNFGDFVGEWIYRQLTGHDPVQTHPRTTTEPVHLFCGSQLVKEWVSPNTVVCGAGIMFRWASLVKPLAIHCVRGPISRQRLLELGHDCPAIYGDPALLLPLFYNRPRPIKYRVGLIPHVIDYAKAVDLLGHRDGVNIIQLKLDKNNTITDVIDSVRECAITLSSSLHGIITSHAYGVPSVWCKSPAGLHGDGVKFVDYYASVGIGVGDVTPMDLLHERDVEALVTCAADCPQPVFPIDTSALERTIRALFVGPSDT